MTIDSNDSRFLANYTAYLLRLWQDSDQTPWRASAQCARTGEKFMFAKLEDLFAFLSAQTGAVQKEIQR